jgi:RNA polymerase sigma-70 factor (ECF subfamily)
VYPNGTLERLWLDGDPRAMEQAHRRYRSRLEAVAYRILRDRADAEDVVQKIFVALRRASYRGNASLWTYLYRAAVNGSVNALRSKRRREAAERQLLERHLMTAPMASGPTATSPESKVLEGEILAAVARALLQVKPQHRRVLTLRIMHGLTNTEIAEHEKLPLATVGTWLRRGRVELQRGLRPLLREMGRGTP